MQKTTTIAILASLVLVAGALYVVSEKPSPSETTNASVQNVEMKDGVQYVVVTARGGYEPRVSQVKAGVPTKLVVKTNGTYDCSAALVVRSVGFQKILPPTGEEMIDLGVLKMGEKMQGVCSMGMYGFQVVAE